MAWKVAHVAQFWKTHHIENIQFIIGGILLSSTVRKYDILLISNAEIKVSELCGFASSIGNTII